MESLVPTSRKTVTGWKGIPDAAHFERLKIVLHRARCRSRFDRAAADRIMDDLRHVAYRNGVAAARVFQFMDDDFIQADGDLAAAKDDLDGMSRNLPFLKTVAAVVEEIGAIQDEMTEEAKLFAGWRPYSGKWAWPSPLWTEMCEAFREGRDDAERAPEGGAVPGISLSEPIIFYAPCRLSTSICCQTTCLPCDGFLANP